MTRIWWALPALLTLLALGCGNSAPTPAAPTPQNPVTQSLKPSAPDPSIPTNQTSQQLSVQADVPVYPGALFPDNVTAPPKKDEYGKLRTNLVMTTKDAPEKVVTFYQKAAKYSVLKTKDGSELQGFSPKGNLVLIDVTVDTGLTYINVKSVQGN